MKAPVVSRRFVVALVVGLSVAAGGCDRGGSEASTAIDDTLRIHEVLPSTPTPEGLAFIQAVADVHREADAAQGVRRVTALNRGLALPVPAGLPEAEVLRLEIATRLAEDLMAGDGQGDAQGFEGARRGRDLLAPMVAPNRSLPLDRVTARALVVLGDAAARTGDDALAAGSYARAIRMMRTLQQELEQR